MKASMRLSACIATSLLACGIATNSKAAPIEIQYNNRSTNQKETIFIDTVVDSWNNIESTIRSQPWWNNEQSLGFRPSDFYGILNGTIIDDGQGGAYNNQKFSNSDLGINKTFGTSYLSFSSTSGLVERVIGTEISKTVYGPPQFNPSVTLWNFIGTDDFTSSLKNWAIAGNIINPGGNTGSGTGINKTSNLSPNGNLFPIFQGGTLTVDQDNQTYSQNFTLDNSRTNAINTAGNNVNFTGSFTGTGTLTITNSGNSSILGLGSSSNPIVLGGLNTSASNSNEFLTVDLFGEADVRGDTIVNYGTITARGKFSTDNLTITPKPAPPFNTGSVSSAFRIGPTDSNHKTTVRNNLSITKNGILNTTSANVANPATTTEILFTAGTVNASQGYQ